MMKALLSTSIRKAPIPSTTRKVRESVNPNVE
jgi:hypothetical protein